MTGIRKILYYFTGFIVFVTLLQLPFAFGVSNVFGDPDNIDQVLKDGGVYDNFVPIMLQDVEKNGDEQAKKLLADKGFKDAISSSIQPNDIRDSSKSVIDGVYSWLEGKTAQPEFTIDLSAPAQKAVDGISAYAEQRSSKLPACTPQQLQTVDLTSDILSIPCLPPGLTSQQVGQQFASEAKSSIEVLKKPVITSKEVLKETDVTSQEYAEAPRAYQNLHSSKWTNLIFAMVLIAALILARRNRPAGIRFVGKIMLAAGLTLSAILLMLLYANSQPIPGDDELGKTVLRSLMSLFGQIAMTVKWFAAGYLIIGSAGMIIGKRLMPEAADNNPKQSSSDIK